MTDTPNPPAPDAGSDTLDGLIAKAAAKSDETILAKIEGQAQALADLLKGISASPETAIELLTLRGSFVVSEEGELLLRQGDELVQPSTESLRANLPASLQKAVGPSGSGTRAPRPVRGRSSGIDPNRLSDAGYFREHRAEVMKRYGK